MQLVANGAQDVDLKGYNIKNIAKNTIRTAKDIVIGVRKRQFNTIDDVSKEYIYNCLKPPQCKRLPKDLDLLVKKIAKELLDYQDSVEKSVLHLSSDIVKYIIIKYMIYNHDIKKIVETIKELELISYIPSINLKIVFNN